MNERSFYIVWNPSGPTMPKARHDTPLLAKAEAKRLAGLHPGQRFYVLCSTGYAEKIEISWTDMAEDMPF